MILRGKVPAEDLVRDDDIFSGSDEDVEIAQSETEEPSDTDMPEASPPEDTALESVEDGLKPVSFFLVQALKGS